MRSFDFLEYELPLSTGEVISVSEVDPSRVPAAGDPLVLRAADGVLSRCTYAPRAAVEDAKNGGTDALEALLGTPPAGCLLKMARPVCAEIRTCILADRRKCTASHVRAGRPDFPACWTYDVAGLSGEDAVGLADSVVDAWKRGRYVVIVRDLHVVR